MNRGNYVIKDIVQACRSNEVTDLVIVQEHRGEPDGLIVSASMPYSIVHLQICKLFCMRMTIVDLPNTLMALLTHVPSTYWYCGFWVFV